MKSHNKKSVINFSVNNFNNYGLQNPLPLKQKKSFKNNNNSPTKIKYNLKTKSVNKINNTSKISKITKIKCIVDSSSIPDTLNNSNKIKLITKMKIMLLIIIIKLIHQLKNYLVKKTRRIIINIKTL